MAKAMGPFRDSLAPYWLSGHQTDVPAEPPLIGHGVGVVQSFVCSVFQIMVLFYCLFFFF